MTNSTLSVANLNEWIGKEVTEQAGGRKLIKLSNTIEIEGETKPALIAETFAMLVAVQ
jgi:hypothetical protein